MSRFWVLLLIFSCAACSKPTSVDSVHRLDQPRILAVPEIADAGTTAIGLWGTGNLVEANPLFTSFGDFAPLAILGARVGARKAMLAGGMKPAYVNLINETSAMVGVCNNIAVLAGAQSGVGLALGVGCAVFYNLEARRSYKEATGVDLYDLGDHTTK